MATPTPTPTPAPAGPVQWSAPGDPLPLGTSTAQRDALHRLTHYTIPPAGGWRVTLDALFGTLFVHNFVGMVIGIEPDGYTHS